MSTERLRESIAQVRAKLLRAQTIHQRDLLGGLLTGALWNLSHRIERPTGRDPLDRYVVDFEVGHPRLAASLREVADSVSKMGV